MKAALQSIILSAIINLLYFLGELATGIVQTVFYQPKLPETNDVYYIQKSITFGYTGNYLAALSIRIGLGALLIFILLKILAKWRAAIAGHAKKDFTDCEVLSSIHIVCLIRHPSLY